MSQAAPPGGPPPASDDAASGLPAAAGADPWHDLRAHTAARLALGRTGVSLPTAELLRFGHAHAEARDAVHLQLDAPAFAQQLAEAGLAALQVRSAAPDRASYLLRPDLGRRLDGASVDVLRAVNADAADAADAASAVDADTPLPTGSCDLLLVVADGLSSLAVERNAPALVAALHAQAPGDWRIGPVVVATQARVALGDEIGSLLGAQLVAVLIGERPGLSAPDSLGIYLTWHPQVGRSDAERNCISNIRAGGLAPDAAARRLWWLAAEARRLRLTGVQLKDRSDQAELTQHEPHTALPDSSGAGAPKV